MRLPHVWRRLLQRLLWSADRIEQLRPWALAGLFYVTAMFAAGALGLPFDFITITGVMGGLFGALYGSLDGYRTQRGLWMLALFYAVVALVLYATFLYHSVADGMAGRQAVDWWLAVDASLATGVLGATVRLAGSIAWHNWRRFHPTVPSE